MKINAKLIKKHMNELTSYDDYIPSLIRFLVNEEYYKNLTKNGEIDKVLEKIMETSYYSYDEQVQEVKKWCKDNPQFSELIS